MRGGSDSREGGPERQGGGNTQPGTENWKTVVASEHLSTESCDDDTHAHREDIHCSRPRPGPAISHLARHASHRHTHRKNDAQGSRRTECEELKHPPRQARLAMDGGRLQHWKTPGQHMHSVGPPKVRNVACKVGGSPQQLLGVAGGTEQLYRAAVIILEMRESHLLAVLDLKILQGSMSKCVMRANMKEPLSLNLTLPSDQAPCRRQHDTDVARQRDWCALGASPRASPKTSLLPTKILIFRREFG